MSRLNFATCKSGFPYACFLDSIKEMRRWEKMRYSLISLCIGLSLFSGLWACAPTNRSAKVDPIGEFRVGHTVVVGKDMVQGPLSRAADPQKIIDALKQATSERLSVYDGSQYYHVAVKIDAYVLAQPGVPVVLSPKSALILQLSVWDNATQTRIAEPEHITLLENLTAKTLIGSGLTQSAEAQIENLAQTAAKRIERWLRDKHEAQGWFAKRTAITAENATDSDGAGQ